VAQGGNTSAGVGGAGLGGGIQNDGSTLTMTGGILAGNQAIGGTGSKGGGYGSGGGLDSSRSSTAVIVGSIFTENEAIAATVGPKPTGASAWAAPSTSGSTRLRGSPTIRHWTLTGSVVFANAAVGGNGGPGGNGGLGEDGGIAVQAGSTDTVNLSTIRVNDTVDGQSGKGVGRK